MSELYKINYSDELQHHGVKGQKWGVRRYQNPDGSLTAAGRLKYRTDSDGNLVKISRKESKSLTETKRQKEISRLNKESRKFEQNESQRFKKSVERKGYANLKSKYPEFDWKENSSKAEAAQLSNNYVGTKVSIATVLAAITAAPLSAIMTWNTTKNGLAATTSALGVIGGTSLLTLANASSQKKSVERKYGLRA